MSVLLIAGCSQHKNSSAILAGTSPEPIELVKPTAGDLQAALDLELEKLGIDPAKETAAAPTGDGNIVFYIDSVLEDVSEDGTSAQVRLFWVGGIQGDYNQDSMVTAHDLAVIGQRWQETVDYDLPGLHDGFEFWPTGDPYSTGRLNWRVAQADGNRNGLIGMGDITTIAQHWQERLSGYQVFRRLPLEPDNDEWVRLPEGSPGDVLAMPGDPYNDRPPYFSYTDTVDRGATYQYKVVPYNTDEGQAGPESLLETIVVNLNYPPWLDLDASPRTGQAPLEVTFDPDGSYDPDGTLVRFEYDFDGDGEIDLTTDNPDPVSYTYETAGTFDARMYVTDDEGATGISGVGIAVENQPPVAQLDAYITVGPAPLEVGLNASASADSDGEIVLYEYDTNGDGTWDTVSDDFLWHTYTEFDHYTARVRVTDNLGATDTAELEINSNPAPEIITYMYPDTGPAPLQVTIDVSSSRENGIPIVKHEWDWDGDGIFESDTGANSLGHHIYDVQGTFEAGFRITGEHGATATGTETIEVTAGTGEPRWHFLVIGEGMMPSMCLVDGNPAVAFNLNLIEDSVCYLRASNPEGTQWGESVHVGPWEYNGVMQGVDLVTVQGIPMIGLIRDNDVTGHDELAVCAANDSHGTAWADPVSVGHHESSDLFFFSIADINGLPAVTYSFYDVNQLFYRRATELAGSTWGEERMLPNINYTPWNQQLLEVEGRPAVSWDAGSLFYHRANDDTGFDWWGYPQLLNPGMGAYQHSMAIVEGNPAIAFYEQGSIIDGPEMDLWFIRAGDITGTSWGTMLKIADSPVGSDWGRWPSMAVVNGKPMVAFENLDFYRVDTLTAEDSTGSTWGTALTLPVAYGMGQSPTLIALADGTPAVCYTEGFGSSLMFAYYR